MYLPEQMSEQLKAIKVQVLGMPPQELKTVLLFEASEIEEFLDHPIPSDDGVLSAHANAYCRICKLAGMAIVLKILNEMGKVGSCG